MCVIFTTGTFSLGTLITLLRIPFDNDEVLKRLKANCSNCLFGLPSDEACLWDSNRRSSRLKHDLRRKYH